MVPAGQQDTQGCQESFSLSWNTLVSTRSTVEDQVSALGHQDPALETQGQAVNTHKGSTYDGVTTGPGQSCSSGERFLTRLGLLPTRKDVYRVLYSQTADGVFQSFKNTLPSLLTCLTENTTQNTGYSSSMISSKSKSTQWKIPGTCNSLI